MTVLETMQQVLTGSSVYISLFIPPIYMYRVQICAFGVC